MDIDYSQVNGVSEDEFARHAIPDAEANDPKKFYKADKSEKERIERLLDVRPGTLDNQEMYLSVGHCDCGQQLKLYDFYLTALTDMRHSKSLLVHTSIGSKRILQDSRPIRCSSCARVSKDRHIYFMQGGYMCKPP